MVVRRSKNKKTLEKPIGQVLKNKIRESLFEAVPCNIAVIDQSFNIVDHNKNFEELFGFGTGNRCYEVYKKKSEPCEDCIAKHTFEDGQLRVNEEVGVDRDGNEAHYLVHMMPLEIEGEISYIVEMSTDVTEIKRLQREYKTLFDKVPCFITVLNRDFRVVRTNERMKDVYGGKVGQRCWEVFKHRKFKCENCPAEKSFESGETIVSEHEGVDKNGNETYYLVTTTPVYTGSKITNVIEMAVDITLLRRTQQEKIVVERLAAVGQTMAGLAHGIKNILFGLEGGMYAFQTGLKRSDEERINEGWGMLERNISKISALTQSLLNFSKGQMPNVVETSPCLLVDEIVKLYEEKAKQKGVEITYKVDSKIPSFNVDPEAMHTLLANLVSNAIDACQIGDADQGKIEIRLFESKGAVVFEVEDNGIGIEEEFRDKVFTTFFTTKEEGGTGLGLLLTRKIAQEHGGTIEVDSSVDEGSVFRLVLPRARLPKPKNETENLENGVQK